MAIGPRLAVADGDLPCVREAGLPCGGALALDDGDFMAALQQMPSGARADDAGAQDDDFHAASVPRLRRKQKRN